MTLESRNALRKTFTRSQIVSVTAAATVLVMAVSTDSGVSRGGMKKKSKRMPIEMESWFVCFTRIPIHNVSRNNKKIQLEKIKIHKIV